MSNLLDYEKSILLDIHEGSCIFVCSEGLDLQNIMHTLIRLHNDPHNLVLVSNYSLDEAKYICAKVVEDNSVYAPSIITAEVSLKERSACYLRGGIVFVSSRILVVDLLRGIMPVELVTGVLVLRCHDLHEGSQEYFMLRLLREKNPQIFVKALTDNPIALMSGYNRVEQMMNEFGTPRLLLWPRFNVDVVSNLSNLTTKVEEIQVFLTENMLTCQSCLLEMIKATLRELVENNPILDNDEFSLESALTNSFNQLTSLYIDPIWHQLSYTSHRLLADVASLRRLLLQLINDDAVSFLDSLENLRRAELSAMRVGNSAISNNPQRGGTCANWLLMKEAEKLLITARCRVYNSYVKRTYAVEVPPKLSALLNILEDIFAKAMDDSKVLILVSSPQTIEQIEYFLEHGKRKLLDWLVLGRSTFEHPKNISKESEEDVTPPKANNPPRRSGNRHKPPRGPGKQVISCYATPISVRTATIAEVKDIQPFMEEQSPVENEKNMNREPPDLPPGCFRFLFREKLTIYLRAPPPGSREEGALSSYGSQSLDGPAGRLAIVLASLRPQHIILFEPKVAWVREVEVFSAREFHRRTHSCREKGTEVPPVEVFFMIHKDSVEEQSYLTRLRREKEAFESLIRLRGSVVIENMDPPMFSVESGDSSRVTREPTVFVDVREFRSELPALLHRKGLKVNPITLSIGDYILAPHLCVERKSVSDLIGSLNSGRLYHQCTAMSRNYLNPVLLIEFSMPANGLSTNHSGRFGNAIPQQGSFVLFTGRHAISAGGSSADLTPGHLMSKLVLLIIHFPNLRILWSVTPYCTAELFAELKTGRDEPSLELLPREGDNLGDDNVEAVDMLLKLPGISWRNYRRVIEKVDSLAELAECSLERLNEILDNQTHAQRLYAFFNEAWQPQSAEEVVNAAAVVLQNSSGGIGDAKRPRIALATRVKTLPCRDSKLAKKK